MNSTPSDPVTSAPAEWFAPDRITSPNVMVLGLIGRGRSAVARPELDPRPDTN
jgi:hypothetical protein